MTTTDIFGPGNSANAVTARPSDDRGVTAGEADSFFSNCTAPGNDDGTDITAGWLNQVTATLRALSRANGLTVGGTAQVNPDNNANDGALAFAVEQLIQRGQTVTGSDMGSANAVAVTLSPAPVEWISGMCISVRKSAAANTGAVTLALNGGATQPVVWADGSALVAGDWPASTRALVEYDQTLSSWMLLSIMGPSVFQRAGLISIPAPASSVTLTQASNQSVSVGVITVAQLSGAGSFFTNASGVLTFTKSGLYAINASILGQANLSGAQNENVGSYIYHNGVMVQASGSYIYASGTQPIGTSCSTTFYAAVGDTAYISGYVNYTSGSSAQFLAAYAGGGTFGSITKLV